MKQKAHKKANGTKTTLPPAPRIPAFKSEAEEADWWDAHPEVIEALFERGFRAGNVTRGKFLQGLEVARTHPTTIRLLSDDVVRAKIIANKKGIRYQTYLKMLIHEGIRRENKAS